jgi:polysaccharide biosynthesis transport protein
MPNRIPFGPPDLAAGDRRSLGVIRRRWRLIVAAAAACCLPAGLYLACAARLYEATARILIVPHDARSLGATGDEAVRHPEAREDFIPTQIAILQSQSVVGPVIASVGPEGLPTLYGGDSRMIPALARRIASGYLKFSRPDKAALTVAIDYRAGTPEEATRFVQEIIRSYERYLEEKGKDGNSQVIARVSRARDELGRQVGRLEAEYLEFQQSHPQLLELVNDGGGRPILASRLQELERAANEASLKVLKLKSQLDLGRKLAEQGTELWSLAFAIAQLGGDPGAALVAPSPGAALASSSDYVRQLVKEEQELVARHGAGFSKARELQDQIREAEQLANDSAAFLDRGKVRQLLASIELGLEAVEGLRVEIGRQYREETLQSKERLAGVARGRELRSSLERQKALLASVVDQLKRAELSEDSTGVHVKVIEPASSSATPVSPRTGLTLALTLLVSVALGFGSALVADGFDDRVRSLAELREITEFEVLGMIPRLTGDQLHAAHGSGLLCHYLPQSLPSEDYKAFRTKLELLCRDRQAKVILVTSPTASEGKSSTASNLSISLAHAGRKVLLVDADLRRPSLHASYGLRLDPGLTHVLKGVLSFQRVVQATPVENLELLAAGPGVSNPAELLAWPSLAPFLEEARRHYDVIVIDSSPLLIVTDPSIIAPLADGVILVVDGTRVRAREAAMAAEMLQAVRTSVLGILVNGCDNWWRRTARYPYAYESSDRTAEAATAQLPHLPVNVNGRGNSAPAFLPSGNSAESGRLP